MSDFFKQFLAILPVFILQLCYGMSGAFPAITTPQLMMDCSLFSISKDEESWIGDETFRFKYEVRVDKKIIIKNKNFKNF